MRLGGAPTRFSGRVSSTMRRTRPSSLTPTSARYHHVAKERHVTFMSHHAVSSTHYLLPRKQHVLCRPKNKYVTSPSLSMLSAVRTRLACVASLSSRSGGAGASAAVTSRVPLIQFRHGKAHKDAVGHAASRVNAPPALPTAPAAPAPAAATAAAAAPKTHASTGG